MSKSQDLIDKMLLQTVDLSNGRYSAPRSIIQEGRKSPRFFNEFSKILRQEAQSNISDRIRNAFADYAKLVYISLKYPGKFTVEMSQKLDRLEESFYHENIHVNVNTLLMSKPSLYKTLQQAISGTDLNLNAYLTAIYYSSLRVWFTVQSDSSSTYRGQMLGSSRGGSTGVFVYLLALRDDLITMFKEKNLENNFFDRALDEIILHGRVVKQTLIHELQHSYDFFIYNYRKNLDSNQRSRLMSAKFKTTKKLIDSLTPSVKPHQVEYLDYYLERIEIQARIQQYFNDVAMEYFTKDPDITLEELSNRKTLRDLADTFVQAVSGHLTRQHVYSFIYSSPPSGSDLRRMQDQLDKISSDLKKYLYKTFYQMLEHELDRIKKEHPELIPKNSLKPALP